MSAKDGSGKPPAQPPGAPVDKPPASRRRQYEYDHQYGLRLDGRALDSAEKPPAGGRKKNEPP